MTEEFIRNAIGNLQSDDIPAQKASLLKLYYYLSVGKLKGNILNDLFQTLCDSVTVPFDVEVKKLLYSVIHQLLENNQEYVAKFMAAGKVDTILNLIMSEESIENLKLEVNLMTKIYNSLVEERFCVDSMLVVLEELSKSCADTGLLTECGHFVVKISICKPNPSHRECLLRILSKCLEFADQKLYNVSCEALGNLSHPLSKYQASVDDILESGICKQVIAAISRDSGKIRSDNVCTLLCDISKKSVGSRLLFEENILPSIKDLFVNTTKCFLTNGSIILKNMASFGYGIENMIELGLVNALLELVFNTSNLIEKEALKQCCFAICSIIQGSNIQNKIEFVKEGRVADIVKLKSENLNNSSLLLELVKTLESLYQTAADMEV